MINLVLISLSLGGRCDERQELEELGAELIDFAIANLDEPVCLELLWETRAMMISQSTDEVGRLGSLTKYHLGCCEDQQEEG